ncbi:unnamed protein product [Ostreobium quekettii]|uniref:Uncharacterized protein n=1 Tax=Ostreobium quekettii TaxID=121088 RepID=A0A8S1IX42_9CHLO|nr:unnamed protein product [Ostreobium quekettii]|eukprot:evm.model.scf_349.2 EVM.evm.TU.scf_349.2   scf_349:16791-18717(+)
MMEQNEIAMLSMPAVVLVEPACLVEGQDCEVEIHLSREVACADGQQVVLRGEDDLVVTAPLTAQEGRIWRLVLPPVSTTSLSVAVEGPRIPPTPPEPFLLVLPEAASNDLRRLFAMMLTAVDTRDALMTADLLHRHPVHPTRPSDHEHLPRPPKLLEHSPGPEGPSSGPMGPSFGPAGPAPLKVAVWNRYFRPLCLHLADLLKGLADGASEAHDACVPTLVYLLDNERWWLASFLLKACLASGVPVTLGPFALLEEDVEPERLRRDYLAIGHGAVLVVGEVERSEVEEDALDPVDQLPRTWIDGGLVLLEPISG